MYLTILATTFHGMQTSYHFDKTLNDSFDHVIKHLIKTYPNVNDITLNEVDLDLTNNLLNSDSISNITTPDFTFKKKNDELEMWIRYNGGDIYITINNISDDINK